jgi:hypothetical protein
METDLDLGDKLRATDKELSGEKLIDIQYSSLTSMSYSSMLFDASANERQSTVEPILQRPITPAQLRKNSAVHAADLLVSSLVINSHSDGFENPIRKSGEEKAPNSTDNERAKSHSSESIHSSTSSTFELNPNS